MDKIEKKKSDKEAKLKVAEAMQDDVNKGIVRIDSSYMHEIGIRPGDIVEINGERSTVGIADRAYPGDIGLNIIRMDGILRRNAKTGIGEVVRIKKIIIKIIQDFSSFESWKEDFIATAKSSLGWAVLCYDPSDKKLHNYLTDFHNNGVVIGSIPLLALDVFEHAYYHDYGPDRAKYIEEFCWQFKQPDHAIKEHSESFYKKIRHELAPYYHSFRWILSRPKNYLPTLRPKEAS